MNNDTNINDNSEKYKYITRDLKIVFYICTFFKRKQFKTRYNKCMNFPSIREFYF